ncbi:hypothetical protein ACIQGZ_16300 [Streptomyces sp. NPDC092296]
MGHALLGSVEDIGSEVAGLQRGDPPFTCADDAGAMADRRTLKALSTL